MVNDPTPSTEEWEIKMSENKTPLTQGPGGGRDPQENANKLRGISPEVLAKAQKLGEPVRANSAEKTQSRVPPRLEEDSSERGKHRHIKDTQQESLVQGPAAGYGMPQENTQASTAKTTDKAVGDRFAAQEPQATADKLRAPSPETAKSLDAARQKLNEAGRGLKENDVKAKEADSGNVKASPAAAPKARGEEGPRR